MAERASAVLVVGRPVPVTSVLRPPPVARTATKELVQVVYKATNDQATVPHVRHCSPARDTLLVVTMRCLSPSGWERRLVTGLISPNLQGTSRARRPDAADRSIAPPPRRRSRRRRRRRLSRRRCSPPPTPPPPPPSPPPSSPPSPSHAPPHARTFSPGWRSVHGIRYTSKITGGRIEIVCLVCVAASVPECSYVCTNTVLRYRVQKTARADVFCLGPRPRLRQSSFSCTHKNGLIQLVAAAWSNNCTRPAPGVRRITCAVCGLSTQTCCHQTLTSAAPLLSLPFTNT